MGEQLKQQRAQRLGNGHLVPAEANEHLSVAMADLAGGHGGDAGLLLAEEQHQAAGDPVDDVEAVVVEEPGQQGPAPVGVVAVPV